MIFNSILIANRGEIACRIIKTAKEIEYKLRSYLHHHEFDINPLSLEQIEKIIKEEAIAGKKILLVTHNIPQAKRLGQDIAFIHRGKVLEHCDKAAFVNHPKDKEINQYKENF